jgi:NAD+ synthase (glutamine-hydrolysing)
MKKNNDTISFLLAQMNTTVGDIRGNTVKIISKIKEAEEKHADAVIFPEMTVTGYPPEDLLLKKRFCASSMEAVREIAKSTGDITAVVGFVSAKNNRIYNSAAVMRSGKITGIYDKINLPNYGVFDEKRYFEQGKSTLTIRIKGAVIGISICEDIWAECPPLMKLKGKMDFLVNISASPYHMLKWKQRAGIFKKLAVKYNTTLLYCNLIGGQDELVFDGHSLIIDNQGMIIRQGKQFEEQDIMIDLPVKQKDGVQELKEEIKYTPLSADEEVYEALKLGVRDYVQKNGFRKVVLGLSGGIDSALVAVIASDALGSDNVNLIFMPSKFSSKESLNDAQKLSDNLRIKMKDIAIQKIVDVYMDQFREEFKGLKQDTTEENLQARIRGNINMAFSNKFGWLVLTTGNKSEMSTGYATLYGDMAGGFAVIKDVPKILVYKLAKMRNKKAGYDLIPENIIAKEPTAELRFNQKDSDSLPEYALLDSIIGEYIENDKTYGELKGKYDNDILKRVIRMIDINEYKRRQAPPGIKITPKAFGRDRRMPITNKYRE